MTLDNWTDMLRNVMATYPIAWISFLIYVSLTAFIFTNLITAVICNDILSTCCEICDQLDLPKPLPKVSPEASGNEIDITKA